MIRFTSAAAGRFEMLDAHARDVLGLIEREAGERGAIAAADVPQARDRLRSALAAHTEPEPATESEGDEAEEQAQRRQHVSLAQRAWPLLDMLERAARKNKPVLWEKV